VPDFCVSGDAMRVGQAQNSSGAFRRFCNFFANLKTPYFFDNFKYFSQKKIDIA